MSKKSMFTLTFFGSLSAVAAAWYFLARYGVLGKFCGKSVIVSSLMTGQLALWW